MVAGAGGAGPGGAGAAERGQAGEEGLPGEGGLDDGDDAQPAATAGTGEDVETEHAAHQRGPGPRPRGAGVAGAGVDVLCLEVGLWAPVADDRQGPARPRGEDAVIQTYVHRGPADEGRQLAKHSRGSKRKGGGPSRHTVWSSTRTRPSPRRRRRA